jgi:integrase/recombinase XerD
VTRYLTTLDRGPDHWVDNSEPGPAVSGVIVAMHDLLRLAVAAYLARFRGQSRIHTESDLGGYLTWCVERRLDPLAASRPHVELYVRWLQEVRRFKPSTVSRRMSVVAGFYRTCVIDDVLQHSPAEYVVGPRPGGVADAGADAPPVRGPRSRSKPRQPFELRS